MMHEEERRQYPAPSLMVVVQVRCLLLNGLRQISSHFLPCRSPHLLELFVL